MGSPTTLAARIAAAAGVVESAVAIRFTAASVVVDVTITNEAAADADAARAALAPQFVDAAAASAFLFPNGESAVLATPRLYMEYGEVYTAPYQLARGLVVGVAVCGGVALSALIALLWIRYYYSAARVEARRRMRAYEASKVRGVRGRECRCPLSNSVCFSLIASASLCFARLRSASLGFARLRSASFAFLRLPSPSLCFLRLRLPSRSPS